MIIIDEYDYVKQILENKVIPKGVSNRRVLLYIAKYYFDACLSVQDMKSLVFQKMQDFNLPANYYQEYKYESYVKDICEKLAKNEMSPNFRKTGSVNLYQSEIEIVNQGENDKEKKLLFTLYVLAKINETNSGWVNNELKDIFQLANITATIKERAGIVYRLCHADLIYQSNRIDNLNIKVKLGDPTEQIVLVINSFENIGNQYIANFKPGWKMCQRCGKLFKTKSNEGRPGKYCKQCAYKIKLEQNNQYYKEKTEN